MKKNFFLKTTLLLFVILLTGNIFCPACRAALKAGCAKVDITPPAGVWLSGYSSRNKPSEGISDELYAKAIVLDDGQNKTAIVSADLLWVPLETTNEVRGIVKQKIGIPESNVLVCATHTHFGPKVEKIRKDWPDTPASKVDKSYVQKLTKRIAESIITAAKNTRPVKLGVVKGEISEIVYNRRTKRPDGKVAMTFRLPPADPNLVFGPIDPQVAILRIEDTDSSILGTIVNYACHPVCGATDNQEFYSISADYPGYTARVVEQMEGGICLFALGTAGNMNPVRIEGENHRSRIGKALGGEVLRRLQFVPTSEDIALKALKKQVILPIKKDLPAERMIDPNNPEEILATEIQVLRIGDIYILGLPGEVLVEIGLEIKKRSGIENLFIISLSNDACGYVCLSQAYDEGGYEPGWGTNLAKGAGEIIIKEALNLINQIK
ncbi:MAG: neutral/alkaline non-lysosomal ceramidase N-terminal domain-containing protein [Phycisphaerae bacterium]|nr:neutral/alkaline non-lysosomal ceramidase N-terminal domain-containing protein [Phycisphaerae bacterium]